MDLRNLSIEKLSQRGVEIIDMAEVTLDLQKPYNNDLTLETCIEVVESIFEKHEVQFALLTALNIDELVEKNMFDEPLNSIIKSDAGLFGIDEILALSIVNIYGSIGLTNFGYVDKVKPKIIGKVDKEGKAEDKCNTFLDDIVGAIIASAASKIAHSKTI